MAATGAAFLLTATASLAEMKIVVDHNGNDDATPRFKFSRVPAPSKTDAATSATFSIVQGDPDRNGGGLEKLHDGRLPSEPDEPGENFFFRAGTEGGRILVDLGKVMEVRQVNTYSWHADTRAPQVYQLYAADGTAEGFAPQPGKGTAPDKSGWKLLARVDTRSLGQGGGQYGVSISDSGDAAGRYRYLLFDIAPTETDDAFGNTFYSEIDVLETNAPPGAADAADAATAASGRKVCEVAGGKYRITIDTSAASDLEEWVDKELVPLLQEWYPRLIELMPSEGFEAPKNVSIVFQTGLGGTPAATSGNRVMCNRDWFRQNLKGEAKGAVVHEFVHVLQRYRGGRSNPNATRPPGWLVEGIADYLRWFKYEPESHGADLQWMRARRNLSLRYDASYRISANFLDWASEKYAKDLVQKLNAAMRAGTYNEDLWKQITGHTAADLGQEWKKETEAKLEKPAAKPS